MDRAIRWSAESLRQLKKLGKKRPRLGEDVASFEDEFSDGRLPGDEVTGIGETRAREHRMTDRSSGSGKRAGFRVYYRYNDSTVEVAGVFLRRELTQRVRNAIQQMLKAAGPL